MSGMSYVIQEIHFKTDIFFPHALYKKWGRDWRQRGAEYPKGCGFASIVSPPCSTLSSAEGPRRTRHSCVTVSHLAWDKLLSLHATVHPLWQRTDSPSVWYCKGTFINVSKAFRTVAVEPVQCQVTFSVL